LYSQVEAGDIGNGAVVATLGGLSVGFDTTDGVKIVHGTTPKATVTQADIQASNGVVHVIDTVLKFPDQNLTELATVEGLSELVNKVNEAGLESTLSGGGPFTVFAPSNAAFAALSAELPTSLSDVILYHVVDGVSTWCFVHINSSFVIKKWLFRDGMCCDCRGFWSATLMLPTSFSRSSSQTPSRTV
jgi:uncharacterized surface protein with fasciclin (FAS1) repeats